MASSRELAESNSLATSITATETSPLLGGEPLAARVQAQHELTEHDYDTTVSSRVMLWEEVRTLCKSTLPVFGTQVLEYSIIVTSVVAIGHLSTTALAASSLGSMTASVTGYSIAQGFTSTLDTLLPSAWTSSQPNLVGLWAQRMTVIVAATLIPIFAIWFNAESILLLLNQEPEVAALAGVYLRWAALGMPAYAFNGIARRYFQSQGHFSVPTHIILVIAPVNAFLNWLLVWGPPPVRLGFIGAPIATAISFNLISILSVLYGVFFVSKRAWHPLSRRMFFGLAPLVRLSLAGVGQIGSEWWSWELVALAASYLGAVELATQSVLLVSASTTYQAPFALSIAASVRIGNLLGLQNGKRAGVAAYASLIIALAIAAIWSAMFFAFRTKWGHIFNDDEAVVALTASILPLVALFQVVDGLSAVTAGILRARGQQLVGALLNLSAYYIIGIPFGVFLAFKRHMALTGLWVGLTVSLVYCAAGGVWLCVRTDWDKEVRKVKDRIAGERKADEMRRAAELHE